jgi:glycosyltransferase involved in cell wall biosynthesis
LTFAARRADACTANSNAMQRELARLTGVDATVIPMGVDPSVFHPADRRGDEPPAAGAPLILFVGRLVEKKGVRHLIEAMPVVRSVVGGARLQIVGDGPERPRLEALVATLDLAACVDFLGAVPNSDLPAYYRRADLFVAPSVMSRDGDTEGLGVVLLEAASSGLPLIGSRIGGIPDIVENEKTGLLVEPGDADGIASAVTRLLSDGGLRHALASNARRAVLERFAWPGVVDRFDALFRSLRRDR